MKLSHQAQTRICQKIHHSLSPLSPVIDLLLQESCVPREKVMRIQVGGAMNVDFGDVWRGGMLARYR